MTRPRTDAVPGSSSPPDVTRRLTDTDWTRRWDVLGLEDQDRPALDQLVESALRRPDDLARVQDLVDTVLLPGIGDYLEVWRAGRPRFGPELADHELGLGALPLLALLATADDVHDAHRARGIPEELSWTALSDLGQQVAKARRVTGRPGLVSAEWLRNVWADGLLWLGRL